MSYDMFFFQLADGMTVEEINAYLKSDEFDAYCDQRMGEDQDLDDEEEEEEEEEEELEENEDEGEDADEAIDDDEEEDLPPIPAQFINMDLGEEALQRLIFRSWLKQTTKPEERSEAVRAFIAGKTEEMPEGCEEDFDCLFEYGGVPGMQPMMFSYGGDLNWVLGLVAQTLADLHPQRIAIYDPQLAEVVDGDSCARLLQSGDKAKEEFEAFLHKIKTDGFVFGSVEENEEEETEEKK